ncbi:MAG: hypothetical protein H6818_18930 [Phycisphaerales bacterium]|nr:hypothetical protein [Phycisphaerales bacterium]MCB9863823.1 hypothetical protein [Phycisphaerales bacterium]
MAEQPTARAASGRLDVTVQEASFVAGSVSPVAIVLRNPFDVPVEIVQIQGPRSHHIYETDRQKAKRNAEAGRESPTESPSKAGLFARLAARSLGQILVSQVLPVPIFTKEPTGREFNITAEPGSNVTIDRDLSGFMDVNVSAKDNATVTFMRKPAEQPAAEEDAPTAVVIQPHCEVVAYFEISTTGWLFFTPTRQPLSTQVTFRVDGEERTQVVESEFEVKPPLGSMVIGAIVGGFLGSLARILNSQADHASLQNSIVAVGAAIIMSLIGVIALSRKTGSQGFITVEDFFGGFVLGSLIGYGGAEYFDSAVVQGSGGAAASQPAG